MSSDKQNLVQETTNFFNIENQPEVASLMHDIEERAALFAKRSKRFISASTQEYRDAEYLDAWRKKLNIMATNIIQSKQKPEISQEVLLF